MIIMDEVTVSYIVFVLAVIPWICYALTLTFFMMSLCYSRLKLHRKSDPLVVWDELPGVSIIKPLMGIDPYLEVNLESHFTIKYPKFELLFCVQDDQDPAINLVNQLKERHPDVDARLFTGGKDGIINPMVNNMAPAYEDAKYDIIWISTSRILASTDVINDMVAKIHDPKVALVHQMPFTTDQTGLAASVDKVYFGSTVARYYQAFHMLGISCFTGMSYLVKREEIEKFGGLSFFGKFLAEDFFIAKLLHEKGFRHQLAAFPAQQNVAASSIHSYKDRMVRWLRLRLNMIPFTAAVLEPLGESIPLGIYMSWSVYHFFGFSPYAFFFIHWAMFLIIDYFQFTGVQTGPLPFSRCTFIYSWIIRELLYIFIFFEAIIGVRRIKWGKRTYRLSNFGESLKIVTDKSILPI